MGESQWRKDVNELSINTSFPDANDNEIDAVNVLQIFGNDDIHFNHIDSDGLVWGHIKMLSVFFRPIFDGLCSTFEFGF